MSGECTSDVMRLEHDSPEQFGECLCQTGCISFSAVYLFIRDVLVYIHFGVLLWDAMMMVVEPKDKVYLFFDFWNQVLLFLTAEVASWSVIARWSEHDMDENCCWDYMPWYSKLFWALYSAVLPSTFLSACVYWIFRHRSMAFIGTEGMDAGILSGRARAVGIVMASAIPAVVIFDFALVAFPLRLMHVFYFAIWYWFYVGITAMFQEFGLSTMGDTDAIYPVLDWSKPTTACLYALLGFTIGVVFYIIFWGLNKVKKYFRRPCPFD